jgi:hypothetical protein
MSTVAALGVALGVWLHGDDRTAAPFCPAGDITCVQAGLAAGTESVSGLIEHADAAVDGYSGDAADVCIAAGQALAADLAVGFADVLTLLDGFESTVCAPVLLTETVARIAGRSVTSSQFLELTSMCSLAVGAVLVACGETTGALAVSADSGLAALGRCSGLQEVGRLRCFATVLGSLVTDDAPSDRVARLEELCAAWPLEPFGDECAVAAADTVFSSVLLSLGTTSEITAGEQSLLVDVFAFCSRSAEAAQGCSRRGAEILVDSGRAGPIGSSRRTEVCTAAGVFVQEACLSRPAGDTGLVEPVG